MSRVPEETVPFDHDHRPSLLRDRAAGYVRVALDGITREYPHMPSFVATAPGDYRTHRELHPAFSGRYDRHSSVAMQWAVVRLLRRVPEVAAAAEARATLDRLLTEAHIAAKVAFFAKPEHRSLERPYGWSWLLTLHHELATWAAPDAVRWVRAVAPLTDLLAANLVAWLPRLTYPQRTGVHPNTAFALSRAHGHAALRAAGGDGAAARRDPGGGRPPVR